MAAERPRLTLEIRRPATLDAETVRALWRLRTGVVQLKPDTDPEADFAAFAERVAHGTRVGIGRDPAGVPRLMYLGARELHRAPGGPTINLLLPDYGFVDRAFRGHPMVGVVFARLSLADICAAPGRPAWLVGSMYPASFARFETLTRVYSRLDPMPGWLAALLDRIGERHYGPRWDPTTGLVELPTLPEPQLTRPPRDATERAVMQRYTALNPAWRDGFGLLGAVRLRPTIWLRGLSFITRRALRERGWWRRAPGER